MIASRIPSGGLKSAAAASGSLVAVAFLLAAWTNAGLHATGRDRRDTRPPQADPQAPPVSIVRLETTRGNVDIEVTRAWAPRGADRFVALVRAGYYDESRFFRIRPGTWVQFGVNGDPATAQAWRGRTFPDDPFVQSNVRGTVAFAFAVPNGRTTQVFVNLRDNSATHDREPFVPFGRVVDGLERLDALNAEHGEGPGGIRAGRQDPFFQGGNAWLDATYPRLDVIRRARIVESDGAPR